jgi:hypothetical protein
MAAKPDVKPTTRIGREPMAELNQPIPPADPGKTLPLGASADARAKAPTRAGKPRAKRGKLQMVLPMIVLWKLRIAAAMEGVSVGQLVMRWITEPLKVYTYPPLPAWLKRPGESEGDSSIAA